MRFMMLVAQLLTFVACTRIFNSAAVLFSKCEQQTSRTDHFHLRLNYIREQVSHEVCMIQYVSTSDNISNLLTLRNTVDVLA